MEIKHEYYDVNGNLIRTEIEEVPDTPEPTPEPTVEERIANVEEELDVNRIVINDLSETIELLMTSM